MATNEKYKNSQGEKQIATNWHTIVACRRTADKIEKYVDKSKEITINGKLISRSYETNEGENRTVTEIKTVA